MSSACERRAHCRGERQPFAQARSETPVLVGHVLDLHRTAVPAGHLDPLHPKPLAGLLQESAGECLVLAVLAQDDSVALMKYLHQNGFHNASVSWKFEYNSSTYKNTLTFFIDERQRAVVDTIVYRGLDELPEDVANVVFLLCADESAWINGTIIRVDGGEKIG